MCWKYSSDKNSSALTYRQASTKMSLIIDSVVHQNKVIFFFSRCLLHSIGSHRVWKKAIAKIPLPYLITGRMFFVFHHLRIQLIKQNTDLRLRIPLESGLLMCEQLVGPQELRSKRGVRSERTSQETSRFLLLPLNCFPGWHVSTGTNWPKLGQNSISFKMRVRKRFICIFYAYLMHILSIFA